jgi:hypothetical protein
MKSPTPNTNDELRGKKPRAWMANYAFQHHICDRCRSRWVEPNNIYCDVCASKIVAYRAQRTRRKDTRLKPDKNPLMVEVVISRNLAGKGLDIGLTSDIGVLLNVKGVQTVDVRDARAGKAKITGYRVEHPTLKFTRAGDKKPVKAATVPAQRSRQTARVS